MSFTDDETDRENAAIGKVHGALVRVTVEFTGAPYKEHEPVEVWTKAGVDHDGWYRSVAGDMEVYVCFETRVQPVRYMARDFRWRK